MRKFLSTLILFFTILNINPISTSAVTLVTNSDTKTNVFLKGIYEVSSDNGDIEPGKYHIELITKNSKAYIFVINKECHLRYLKRFDSETETDLSIFSDGTLLEGDSVIIFGSGEFYFDDIQR